jgi:hypothetical protein
MGQHIMNENEKKYYFSAVKLCSIIILIIYFVSGRERSLHIISLEWFLLAVLMIAALGFELTNLEFAYKLQEKEINLRKWLYANKKKLLFLSMEAAITLILIIYYSDGSSGIYLLPMVVLDTVIFFHLPFACGWLSFFGLLLNPDDLYIYICSIACLS